MAQLRNGMSRGMSYASVYIYQTTVPTTVPFPATTDHPQIDSAAEDRDRSDCLALKKNNAPYKRRPSCHAMLHVSKAACGEMNFKMRHA